ncbi:MAG: hypothetical protein OXI91_08470 [Chloroflexota bacterium]|nr:hypothetical protein [Chloroflexota bacterium]
MAAATDYLRILGDLGIDTDQSGPRQDNSSRILRGKDGRRYSGLHLNRQAGITYFVVSPGAAAAEIDWNLWQEAPPSVSIPRFDLDKQNIVPKPGQERRALQSLLGVSSSGGLLNFLKGLFGR